MDTKRMPERDEWVVQEFPNVEIAQKSGFFDWLNTPQGPIRNVFSGPVGVVFRKEGRTITGLPGLIETSLPHARLIAAAPELLEELRLMRDWLQEELGEWLPVEPSHYPRTQLVEMREHLDCIETVIAKVEGR